VNVIALLGSQGRMGLEVQKAAGEQSLRLLTGHDPLNWDLESCSGIIDFSSPTGLMGLLHHLDSKKLPQWVISGTTGFSDPDKKRLADFARNRPLVIASNFSIGVHVLHRWLKQAVNSPELSPYTISLRETHHVHKKDKPSGTALSLQKLLPPGTSIESLRVGETIGTHEIWFDSPSDRLGLIHEAKDRSIFAKGALQTATELALRLKKNPDSLPKRILGLEDLFST